MERKLGRLFAVALVGCFPGPALAQGTASGPAVAAEAGAAVPITETSDNGRAQATITTLTRRRDGTSELRFSMKNVSNEAFNVSRIMWTGNINLLDPRNLQRYSVVNDLYSSFDGAINPGGEVRLWARFAGPPVGATEVEVLLPGFMPIEGVRFSK